MKALKIIGMILIVIGIIMIITGSFSYKQKEKIVDTNVVDLSVNETKTVAWPRFAGAIVIAAGVFLLVTRNKKNNNSRGHAALAD